MNKSALFLILAFSIACNNRNKEHVEYFKVDNIVIKKVFIGDTMVEMQTILADSVLRDGLTIQYKHGKVCRKMFFNHGHLSGSHYEYYDNGNVNIFICHDSFGDTIFYRKYNLDNTNIIEEKGDLKLLGCSDTDSWTNRIEIVITSFIVHPPKASISHSQIMVFNGTDTIQPDRCDSFYDWVNNFSFPAIQPGKYEFFGSVTTFDSIKRKTYIHRSRNGPIDLQ